MSAGDHGLLPGEHALRHRVHSSVGNAPEGGGAGGRQGCPGAGVLIHEFAHIQRRDPWVLRLQRLVTIPLWFHPLVHWMNRELDRAREELCDNHVLRDSSPSNYAETLLALALQCPKAPGPTLTLSILRGEHHLASRIRRLLDGDRDRSTRLATGERIGDMPLIAGLIARCGGVRLDGVQSTVRLGGGGTGIHGLPVHRYRSQVSAVGHQCTPLGRGKTDGGRRHEQHGGNLVSG